MSAADVTSDDATSVRSCHSQRLDRAIAPDVASRVDAEVGRVVTGQF
jgi:hypothetical protein